MKRDKTAIFAAGILACTLICSCSLHQSSPEGISRDSLIGRVETSLNAIGSFQGTLTLSMPSNDPPYEIEYRVISKNRTHMFVDGRSEAAPLRMVSIGKDTWMRNSPTGTLMRLPNLGDAVTSHPSMHSFLEGILYGLRATNSVYEMRDLQPNGLLLTIRLPVGNASFRYKIHPDTFLVEEQFSNSMHGYTHATWSEIDLKTELTDEFFEQQLSRLKNESQ